MGKKLFFIPRDKWGGFPALEEGEELKLPIRTIMLTHTATPECYTYEQCCNTLKVLQRHYYDEKNYKDLPFNFLVSNRRFFEGKDWRLNGIPKPPEEEKVEKTLHLGDDYIENFLFDLEKFMEDKKNKNKEMIDQPVLRPAEIVHHIQRKRQNYPYEPGMSIAFIDDFVPVPKFGRRRLCQLFDFIKYGIKKKIIDKSFRFVIEGGKTITEEQKLDYLWKGREHTTAYKIAMEIRKLNDNIRRPIRWR